jgi:hypothetical protein
MKKIVFFGLILFATSCCTPHQDCIYPPQVPFIYLYVTNDSLTGFTDEQLNNMQIILTDKNNYNPIDSCYLFFDTISFGSRKTILLEINDDLFYAKNIPNYSGLSNYNYFVVIRKANVIDTISGVNASYSYYKVDCKSCLPFENSYQNQSELEGVQYYFNRTLKSNMNDSTLIHR